MTSNGPDLNILTPMELDVIGEVMNISMGSGATAMSTVLDAKVNITTPRIEVVPVQEFEFAYLEPVVGVSIKYVEGIDGVNVLLLREEDLKKILSHLLSVDNPDEIIFDEIATSAVCEIMNQMMGSSASALAQFLGKPINISPPEVVNATSQENIKEMFAIHSDVVVSIKFDLQIEDLVESEFISAMDPDLVRKIVNMTMGLTEDGSDPAAADSAADVPQESVAAEPEPVMQTPAAPPIQEPMMTPEMPPQMQFEPQAAPQPQVIQPVPPQPQVIQPIPEQQPMYGQPPQMQPMYGQPQMQQPMYGQPPMQQPMYYQQPPMQQPMYGQPPMQMAPAPNVPAHQVNASPYSYKQLGDAIGIDLTEENNLELVMSVPIQVTVELGTTKKKIKDIVELCPGNIVELDRQAGDQVDIFANGRLIAKGDVVVVDDNYSVRITEIVKREDANSIL